MTIHTKKQQVLEILVKNLRNPQPQVVNSELIADKLNMSTKDTCQLLKVMHEMGLVVSDLEGQNSLITKEGLNCLQYMENEKDQLPAWSQLNVTTESTFFNSQTA